MHNAFEPACSTCKYFIRHNRDIEELGLCKMFTNICYDNNNNKFTMQNFAQHCRNDENLCGNQGYLYEHKDSESKKAEMELQKELIELNNRCCGEVNEKDEIEELEKDFFDIFQKIKKHNKRKIYRTSQEIFKLFKRNN
jgi:hypothetical protein